MLIVGQEKLKNHFTAAVSKRELNRFIILEGPKGQGKKTLASFIASLLSAHVYYPADLKVQSVRGVIEDATTLVTNKVYILADSDTMTIPAQNALLKLAEEPPQYAYIIMTVETRRSVLPTILSRCSLYQMEKYTFKDLEQFTSDQDLLLTCENPGQVKRMETPEYKNLLSLCSKVVDNIDKISSANAFQILKHVKEEDYDLLIPTLLSVYGKLPHDSKRIEEIRVLHRYKHQVESKSINTQNSLEMMFLDLREAAILGKG